MNWTDAELSAAAKWSGFRQWISKNPLSGFWVGVAAGVVLDTLLGLLF